MGTGAGMRRVQRRSKYRAVRTEVDGVVFASKAEARRYRELFDLTVERRDWRDFFPVKIGEYRADFRYEELTETGGRWDDTVEDVKGMKTALYRWKKKHFEAQYGIQIREITT
jgi:hypothetical protein